MFLRVSRAFSIILEVIPLMIFLKNSEKYQKMVFLGDFPPKKFRHIPAGVLRVF